MIELDWTELAAAERNQIVDFIALDNIDAAVAMDILIENSADSLLEQPERGRPGRVIGTRELIFHEHYMLVYHFDSVPERISILNVLHTSRQWPAVE